MKTEILLSEPSPSSTSSPRLQRPRQQSLVQRWCQERDGLVAWLMTLLLPVTEAWLGIVNEAKLCQ